MVGSLQACCAVGLSTAWAGASLTGAADPLEPARAALRTLQFSKAIDLLGAAGSAGNPDAEYLLGLIYLNGVGVVADPARARVLLQSAAEHGHGAAAYVLAGELSRAADPDPDGARRWLERSASLGYARAEEALQAGPAAAGPRERGRVRARAADARG